MRRFLSTLALAAIAASATGCTNYRPINWNPFTWNKPADGTTPLSPNQPPSLAGRDLSKPPGQQTESWLTTAWKDTTKTLSAPFKTPQVKEDPVSLNTPAKPSSELYAAVGEMQGKGGDLNAAMAYYEKALQLNPTDLKARLELARAYDKQGNAAVALNHYQQAAQAHPDSAIVHNDLGLYYARQNNVETSISEFEQAVRLDPANQKYRNNIATVLIVQSRDDEAFEHLSAVSPPAVAHYNFGYLLHQRKQDSAAIRELETAVRLDPSIKPAETLLAQLQHSGSAPPSDPVAQREGAPAAPAGYQDGAPIYQR